MFSRINNYVFVQILKSFTLIFFIFLSISWLLQVTRLLTLTNLVQIDILSIFYLSLFLIPNLIAVIMPFILIFGVLLCFIKLNRDKEILAMFSLGMKTSPIKYPLVLFTFFIIIFYLFLNLYLSPAIYEKYKIKEFELRNTINFDKMIISNFIKLNKDTTIDFNKTNDTYEDIFISFFDDKENLIYAKKGYIKNESNQYIFQLDEGFKISINDNNEIEKLEFNNYLLKINNKNDLVFDNFDKNTNTIIEDLKNNNYINIAYKFSDIIFTILIMYFFYQNNLLLARFNNINNFYFIVCSLIILVANQLLKNSEIRLEIYIVYLSILILILPLSIIFRNYKNV